MKTRHYITIGVTLAALVTIFILAAPMLSYAEGWNTFYWDRHYIASEFSAGNSGMLAEGFFLQFFHSAWHGVALMSLLFLAVESLLMLAISKMKGGILDCIIPLAATVFLALLSASKLSHTSIQSIVGLGNGESKKTTLYKQLSNMEREHDWDGIIEVSAPHMPESNRLIQNMINMAMAEKCMLHEHLSDNPCTDITSIYVADIESEYIAAMLSDIYYSMGHIAQSQRYAFEANEKMNNRSPRLLQRLILTNIIYGQYAVAKKYLKALSAAAYYKGWCEQYMQKLNDAAVKTDKALSEKRMCLNITNKFSGFNGLDKDLLMIARATRGQRQSNVTVQYLSALYRLAGYKAEYQSLLKEFHLHEQ